MPTTLQALSVSLEHWQALYIIAIVIAVLSTLSIIVFNFHLKSRTHGLKVSNYVYAIAACLSVVATLAIISKTRAIDAEKDRQLKIFQDQSDVQVQQFKAIAAQAVQKTAEAQGQIAALKSVVSNSADRARKAESTLAAQNAKTDQFTHALQLQQETMAEQMRVSPVLSPAQIATLSDALRPFAGQDVILHSTLDTTVLRLKQSIAMALYSAGITFKQNSMDAGMLYQGVSVVVHSPENVPPLANTLVSGLRSSGISVNPVVLDTVPIGKVAIYLGPN